MPGFGTIFFSGNNAGLPGAAVLGVNNGLSLSTLAPLTGVLGQDAGQVGNPAALLTDRQIPADNQSIFFTCDTALGSSTQIAFTEPDFLFAVIAHLRYLGLGSGVGFQIVYDINTTGEAAQINFSNNGTILFTSNTLSTGSQNFQFLGSLTNKRFNSAETANFVLSSGFSGATHTNLGAGAPITGSLPANPEVGEFHTFYIQNVNGITIQAAGIHTITINTLVTAPGGSVNSIVVGSAVTLEYMDNNEWNATSALGTWT